MSVQATGRVLRTKEPNCSQMIKVRIRWALELFHMW